MKIIHQGITRKVFVFNKIVIKIPNFSYSYRYFLQGLLANMSEATTYKYHTRKDLLCPVVWTSWGGWILIMKKADVDRHIKEVENGKIFLYSKFVNAGIIGDEKCDNFGYYNNKLVKIDYGSI